MLGDFILALADPRAYPFAVDRVDVRQTHASILFFAGDRVYKVKKPVNLGFLDFSTLRQRRYFCHEEVRLNRRLAPDVYLGVVPVVRLASGAVRFGLAAAAGRSGRIVEYAVEMRRLPEERMLDRMLEAGGVDNAVLDAIADLLVRFHQGAATGPGVDEHGRPEAVARVARRNLEELRRFAGEGGPLSPSVHARLAAAAETFLRERHDRLEERVAAGRIRDGHGDLHAGNICLTRNGIVVYDCIEFDAALRCGDTARDLAFLVMDLDYRGFRGFGGYLAHRYAAATADATFGEVLPFYKRHFACVRAMVAAILAADPDLEPAARNEERLRALRYFNLAGAYLLPPSLVLLCGLPGSGKSFVARHLARPLGAAIVHSDVVRKRLAGIGATERVPPDRVDAVYSGPMSRQTYQAMLEEASGLLAGGRAVVADATFPLARARRPFVELAETAGARWTVVYLDPPEDVVAQRLDARRHDPQEVSDADLEVYRSAKSRFEPPHEAAGRAVESHGAEPPDEIAARVIENLLAQAVGR